ncbi:ScbA/BarX family gamma-butyrolactone biosynthesis protein [Streptomyces sp. NPDC003393]
MTLLTLQEDDRAIPAQQTKRPQSPDTTTMPRLTTTVPREYVHRSSLAEVFLTGCEKLDDTHYSLTGQWPRAHTFFTSADGTRHDPMQAVETIRQVGLYLAHAELGVPLGHQFLMWDIKVTTHAERLLIGAVPSDLTLKASCTDMAWKGRRLSEFTMHIDVERNGLLCASGGGRFSCIAPATYRRLRGAAAGAQRIGRMTPPSPEAPSVYGRILPFDVVLSPTGRPGHWLVDPDPRHPILFDHNADHIPGMVLLEAARQAACSLARPHAFSPSNLHAAFLRYAEFDAPCRLEAAPAPSTGESAARVLVTGRQGDADVFTAEITGTLS